MSILKSVTLTIITLTMTSIVYQQQQLEIIHKDAKHHTETYQCAYQCNPKNDDFFKLHDSQVVKWGGCFSNKQQKKGDLVVYNTDSKLVFIASSTASIKDFKFDGISTGLNADKGCEIRFSIPLPPGWNSCDPEVHHIQLIGEGPPIVFCCRYYLIGSCPNNQLQAVSSKTGVDITELH
ncbi:MAG: hypothetical protein K1X55_03190 [Chitinophagales bacterium]|nr:hypothetical protein [Chitinophagales bacterium]